MKTAILLLLVTVATTFAQYPNGWRGDGTGLWPDAKVPVEWDGPSGKNIRWKVPLPTRGSNAGPVFGPGKVLVTSEPDIIQCFSTTDGTLLWQDRFSAIDVVAPAAEQEALEAKYYEGFCLSFGIDPKDNQKSADPATPKGRGAALLAEVFNKVPMRNYPMAWAEVGHTSCMPAATRDRVVVRHCSNVMGCYDWNGKRLWVVRPEPGDIWLWDKNCLLEYGSVLIVDDLVVCTFAPNAKRMGISEEEYKRQKLPSGDNTSMDGGEIGFPGVEALVAFDLETGKERWRSEPVRNCTIRSNPLVMLAVGGEKLVLTGGGCVVRAKDGKVVLKDIGWSGWGGTAGVAKQPASDGSLVIAFDEGSRRWSPRLPDPGRHVYAYKLARSTSSGQAPNGDDFKADKLWEWGYRGPAGVSPRAPLIVGDQVWTSGGRVNVFNLADGAVLLGPSEATPEGDKKFRPPEGLKVKGLYQDAIVIGGNLYLADEMGTVFVSTITKTASGDIEAKLLHHNRLDPADAKAGRSKDPAVMGRWLIATPGVWEDCLYIRQNSWLWCIGDRDPK
jgi:outer membrane protein assembly factor BamB